MLDTIDKEVKQNNKAYEESDKYQDAPIKQPDDGPDIWDDGNLVNAFDLLLRIDMRINPKLYKVNKGQKTNHA